MSALSSDEVLPPVLVVDDDPDDVCLLRRLLSNGGVRNPVTSCDGVDGAIARLSDPQAAQPTVIFADIKMPEQGGLELLSWIRHQPGLDRLRVVILSSSQHPSDVARAARLGADGYLAKFPAASTLAEFLTSGPRFSVVPGPTAFMDRGT